MIVPLTNILDRHSESQFIGAKNLLVASGSLELSVVNTKTLRFALSNGR